MSSSVVTLLVNSLDLFVVPLVNPDGRDHVMAVNDYEHRMWRDDRYREYISAGDLEWYRETGNLMRNAIARVRGRVYTVQQSVGPAPLYPVSATADDYAYSRAFANPALRSVRAMTIETGRGPVGGDLLGAFQPPYEEARRIIEEAGPALVEFCMSVLCPGRGVAAMRPVLDRHLGESGKARELYDQLLGLGPQCWRRSRTSGSSAPRRPGP